MQKDFRTGWLLLLLLKGPSYGYELRRALGARELDLDPAVTYRSLREMERAALITSRWMRSDAGPKRRVYDITDRGRAELGRIAQGVRVTRDAQSVFLDAYEAASEGSAPRRSRRRAAPRRR